MRMYPSRILCHALALFALSAVSSGCVKRMTAANEPARTEVSSFAKLSSVTVSADGSHVELVSDKPFTYTSYKSGDPVKIVVDVSQTEPGSVASPIEVNRGSIRRIELVRQQIGAGVLTRAEILLVKDVDFTAATDPSDRNKLEIVLLPPAGEAKSPQAESKEVPLSEVRIEEKSLAPEGVATADAVQAGKAPSVQSAASEAPTPALAVAAASPSQSVQDGQPDAVSRPQEAPVLRKSPGPGVVMGADRLATPKVGLNAVLLASDGIDLSIEGGVQTFNSFKLTKPDRIVVDIFGLKNVLPKNIVPIGAFGVANLRIGQTPDKLRVVLDAAQEILPPYEVVKSDLGVKIRFKVANAGEIAPVERPGATAVQAVPVMAAPVAKAPVAEAPVTLAPAPAAPVQTAPARVPVPVAPVESLPVVAAPVAGRLVPVIPPPATLEVQVPPARLTGGSLETLDFKIVDGVSRITIGMYGSCEPGEAVHGLQGISLAIRNCQVPKRLQRALNTAQFGSPVLSVTPYQVKVKGTSVAKLLVRLRGNPAFTSTRRGDILVLDIANPGPLPEPKLPAAPVRAKVVEPKAAEQKMAEELAPQARPEEAMTEMPKPDSERRVGRKAYSGRRVTLEFSDADVRKIFQLIAEVSNLNFLIADDVTGTISIKLVNVPWDQALDVILDAKGLGMQREGNIVQIKPKAKIQTQAEEELANKKAAERGMELRTAVFEVNYASVADVAAQFAAIKSDRGTISKDDRTSRVIVKDIQTSLDDMRQLLKTLDAPEKQVMIEARIVEATSTFTRDLGVQWDLHFKDGSGALGGISAVDSSFGGVVSPTGPGTTGNGGLGLGMAFGKLGSNIQLDMRLSAAATIGQIKIISTPKVVTLNNKAAKISQGQSIPYQTTSAEGTKTEFVEAALTLEVTPHITADGAVSMKIKASNNSPGVGSPPPINKKEATTELVVSNGETTVIGGIYVDSDTESDTGVPFLADIPLLGWMFKSNSKQKTKTELLIFITPKVVL